ncbi:MAG: hypothetical protein ACQEQV_03655 [Fibrobacterota bacterium]
MNRILPAVLSFLVLLACVPAFQQQGGGDFAGIRRSGTFRIVSEYRRRGEVHLTDDTVREISFYSRLGQRYLSLTEQDSTVLLDVRNREPVPYPADFTLSSQALGISGLSAEVFFEILSGRIPPSIPDTLWNRTFRAKILRKAQLDYRGIQVVLSDPDEYHFRNVLIRADSSNYIKVEYR